MEDGTFFRVKNKQKQNVKSVRSVIVLLVVVVSVVVVLISFIFKHITCRSLSSWKLFLFPPFEAKFNETRCLAYRPSFVTAQNVLGNRVTNGTWPRKLILQTKVQP